MGLTFAALLITQQGSIFCGLMLRTAVADHRHHRRRPLGDGPERPPGRRQQADDREQPLPGPRGRGGPAGPSRSTRGTAGPRSTTDPTAKPEEGDRAVILLGLDDSSMVGGPPDGADPGRQAGRPPQARRGLRRPHAAHQALPGTSAAVLQASPTRSRRATQNREDHPLLPRQRDRDERPPGDHRRDLRGDADLPVERGRSTRPIRGPRATSPRSARSSPTSWRRSTSRGTRRLDR